MPALSSINISQTEQQKLLKLARDTLINSFASNHTFTLSSINDDPSILNLPLGCFITLTIDDELKGCIGTIESDRPLSQSIPDLATSSAFYDRRFSPLLEEQLEQVRIEISLLSPLSAIDVSSQAQLEEYLSINKLGVLLSEGDKRSVFLPQVWQQLPQPKHFLDALKNKAGWPCDYWSKQLSVKVFSVVHFSEPN
ncbi:AmmeMemoRadiSam system protein A [Shewanella sp. UCD-KL12]|uniref:AmmeMemoRadiSam system protein A n=1 Tax=Shewanella sp. UCD-KL12 TaxID=1917163 RepID=UPI000970C05D|nr:AmmeMemoRadiSam system protein A [Shewanella sp. UCD-KL12]